MKHRISKISSLLVAVLLFGLIASPAMAVGITQITQPDAAYVGATTKIDISGLTDYTNYSSITDGYLTVSFDTAMNKRTVPGSWATWASPPHTETNTPHVLFTGYTDDMTMAMDKPCRIFGFELEPNPFTDVDYDVDFILLDGSTVVGTISMTINGSAGARLIAAEAEGASFNKIVIDSNNTNGFAIAQVRYDSYAGWVTGGGKINRESGRKAAWTFGGNTKWDEDGYMIGQFQIVDHENKVSYHLDTVNSLSFSGGSTESPYADHNTATIEASGYDKEGNPVSVTIVIEDIQEPGNGYDTIDVSGDIDFDGTIDGGNFQIHPPEMSE